MLIKNKLLTDQSQSLQWVHKDQYTTVDFGAMTNELAKAAQEVLMSLKLLIFSTTAEVEEIEQSW